MLRSPQIQKAPKPSFLKIGTYDVQKPGAMPAVSPGDIESYATTQNLSSAIQKRKKKNSAS